MRFLIAVSLLGLAAPGWACTCASYEPVKACEKFHSSAIIVHGRVVEHLRTPGGYLTRLRVIEALKGLPNEARDFFVSPSLGIIDGPSFPLGEEFIFYQPAAFPARTVGPLLGARFPAAWKGLENAPLLSSSVCDPAHSVTTNDPDLAFLRAVLTSAPSAPGWIEGSAAQNVDWPSRNTDYVSAQDAVVKLIARNGSEIRTTVNPDGTFRRDAIPPGEYRVEVDSPVLGWAKGPGRIVVPPAGCAVVRASFDSRATVAGRILDAEGNPAPNVRVEIGELLPGGKLRVIPMTWADSNERGEFRVPNVPVGRVVLGANLNGAPSAREPFDSVYVPGTQKLAEARVFAVLPGEQVVGVDLRLPPPLPMGELLVDVEWPDGTPARGGARAFAYWNGARAASGHAEPTESRVRLLLAPGRSYQITADWYERSTGPSRSVGRGPAQTVDFQVSGQVVTVKVGGYPTEVP